MLSLIPLALLIALSVIYFTDLGFKVVAGYWLVWAIGLVAISMLAPDMGATLFMAYQAILAVILWIHIKSKT